MRLGTRSSALARTQSQWVADRLMEAWPDLQVELVFIKTTGDLNQVDPLGTFGGKGVFTREIEVALIEKEIDFAVHSLKDLPSVLPPGLRLASVPARADCRDALVGPGPIGTLSPGMVVGTGSQRRQVQLKAVRPDLEFRDIRGNVPTRIEKWRHGPYNGGVVLAMAGLERLGLLGPEVFPLEPELCLSAPCQGILGLECRQDDERTLGLLQTLENPRAAVEARAERAFLAELEGNCSLPAGCLARYDGGRLRVEGMLHMQRFSLDGSGADAERLGREVAQRLKG